MVDFKSFFFILAIFFVLKYQEIMINSTNNNFDWQENYLESIRSDIEK